MLVRLAAGEHTAFTLLIRQHTPSLLGYAIRLTGDSALAEDIVQDVWCWIWEHRDSVGRNAQLATDSAFMQYMRRAAYHRMIDVRRTSRASYDRAQRAGAEWGRDGVGNDGEYAVEQAELAALIEHAIGALSERRRDILLRRWREQSLREIAQGMGISIKTVEAQITAAYAALRDALGARLEKER